ncbi:MAG: helix-turn-helix transcriptional regulator [Chloroflexi bacterium]|nr:MAG: helix-turn-helix transcriptional regulator [Chloroflexota bacterium]
MNVQSLDLELASNRRRAGLTQRQVAQRMGTTQSAIARAESGAARPSLAFIDRFSRATGISIVIAFGKPKARTPSVAARRKRIRTALGDVVFDPWLRNPSRQEQRALEARGLTREYFQGKRPAP